MVKVSKIYFELLKAFFWVSISYAFFGVVFSYSLNYSQGCFIALLASLATTLFFICIERKGLTPDDDTDKVTVKDTNESKGVSEND